MMLGQLFEGGGKGGATKPNCAFAMGKGMILTLMAT